VLAAAQAGRAQTPAVDVNVVTAVDISESVAATDMRRQIAALAAAVRAPEFMAAIRRGGEGRIGFAMFVWHNDQIAVVPWTPIATERDAEAVARLIEERTRVDVHREARGASGRYIGRLTDLSRAIDHAAALLDVAPFSARRDVVNIVGNGNDNMGELAARARDRLVARGSVVNGVVPRSDPAVLDYYRTEVAGGAGAFVLTAEDGEALAELMRRKFLADLVAAAPLAGTRH
jgi:hypothetical protein